MKKIKFSKSPISLKVTYVVFLAIFIVFALIYLYPIFWATANSLKSTDELNLSTLTFPKQLVFSHYVDVFTEFRVVNSVGTELYYFDMLFNSLWILVVNVMVNVSSSALLAYAIARYRFPGRNALYAVVIFANTIPIIGAGPAAFKLANSLNLVNNPLLIWVMWASGFDFAFIVLYGYFRGISGSYSESAKIDGASNMTVFLKIIIPQVVPCIVAIAITQAIGIWNNYSISMVYLPQYPNLAYGMYLFKDKNYLVTDPEQVYLAAAVVSCIPVIVLYASTQNLILTNMTTGGLKG